MCMTRVILPDEQFVDVAQSTLGAEEIPRSYTPGDTADRLALRKAYAWRPHGNWLFLVGLRPRSVRLRFTRRLKCNTGLWRSRNPGRNPKSGP